MENWLLVTPKKATSWVVSFVALLLVSGTANQLASAKERQQIRFYKVNKIGQTTRIAFTAKKARKVGCHNFIKKARVYQANQFGFAACQLFRSKNCVTESLIEVNRNRDETPTTLLSQGFSWHPISDNPRGVKLKSWSCSLD